jgi:hypothetical protein
MPSIAPKDSLLVAVDLQPLPKMRCTRRSGRTRREWRACRDLGAWLVHCKGICYDRVRTLKGAGFL